MDPEGVAVTGVDDTPAELLGYHLAHPLPVVRPGKHPHHERRLVGDRRVVSVAAQFSDSSFQLVGISVRTGGPSTSRPSSNAAHHRRQVPERITQILAQRRRSSVPAGENQPVDSVDVRRAISGSADLSKPFPNTSRTLVTPIRSPVLAYATRGTDSESASCCRGPLGTGGYRGGGGVAEDVDLALAAPADDHRLHPEPPRHVVARLGDLALVGDKQPGPREDPAELRSWTSASNHARRLT